MPFIERNGNYWPKLEYVEPSKAASRASAEEDKQQIAEAVATRLEVLTVIQDVPDLKAAC